MYLYHKTCTVQHMSNMNNRIFTWEIVDVHNELILTKNQNTSQSWPVKKSFHLSMSTQ